LEPRIKNRVCFLDCRPPVFPPPMLSTQAWCGSWYKGVFQFFCFSSPPITTTNPGFLPRVLCLLAAVGKPAPHDHPEKKFLNTQPPLNGTTCCRGICGQGPKGAEKSRAPPPRPGPPLGRVGASPEWPKVFFRCQIAALFFLVQYRHGGFVFPVPPPPPHPNIKLGGGCPPLKFPFFFFLNSPESK